MQPNPLRQALLSFAQSVPRWSFLSDIRDARDKHSDSSACRYQAWNTLFLGMRAELHALESGAEDRLDLDKTVYNALWEVMYRARATHVSNEHEGSTISCTTDMGTLSLCQSDDSYWLSLDKG